MRITPLAIWTSSLTDKLDVFNAIKSDVEITHPNKLVHAAISLYCLAIHFLIKNRNEINRA